MNGNIGGYPGMTAPDFSLSDGDGEVWRLSDHRGKVVVLMFYPGDETPTCTKQMCSVRDRWQEYAATGAEVVGLSSDSVESHKSFARNHSLPLRLLADEGQKVARLYAATSFFPGKSARAVIVIDGEGRVAYRKLRPLIGMLIAPKDDETIAAILAAQNNRAEQPGQTAAI
jgi:peroxiredoxin Q/BCP